MLRDLPRPGIPFRALLLAGVLVGSACGEGEPQTERESTLELGAELREMQESVSRRYEEAQ